LGKTLAVLGIGLFSLTTPPPSFAQVPVTLQLRSGERLPGTLIDLSAVGFTLRTDGRDRRFALDEVVALEFVPGTPGDTVRQRLERGAHVIVLRSGHTIAGRLIRMRGAIPLRMTIETPDGDREVTSHEIAQVFLAMPVAAPQDRRAVHVDTARTDPFDGVGERSVVQVQAGELWTDTGLTVARGERVLIHGSGTIRVGAGTTTGPEGIRAATSETAAYPVAGAPVGALIGRVGNGTPFAIDDGSRVVRMPNPGRLMLGVNDDNARDNSGTFTVTITRHAPR
jgi:hypothetical protein